jgi:hypothetical protein
MRRSVAIYSALFLLLLAVAATGARAVLSLHYAPHSAAADVQDADSDDDAPAVAEQSAPTIDIATFASFTTDVADTEPPTGPHRAALDRRALLSFFFLSPAAPLPLRHADDSHDQATRRTMLQNIHARL